MRGGRGGRGQDQQPGTERAGPETWPQPPAPPPARGCSRNPGAKWRRVAGTGGPGRGRSFDPESQAAEGKSGGSAVVRGGEQAWGGGDLPSPLTPAFGALLQLGPQAHVDDPESGQCPVPALSHHGCQVRGGTAAAGGRGVGDPKEAHIQTPRRSPLPSILQQPELAELWHLEGRWDPDRRQRRGRCAPDPVHLGVSALLPSEGRGPPCTPSTSPPPAAALPRWQDRQRFLED